MGGWMIEWMGSWVNWWMNLVKEMKAQANIGHKFVNFGMFVNWNGHVNQPRSK